jgi:hypothetical protein
VMYAGRLAEADPKVEVRGARPLSGAAKAAQRPGVIRVAPCGFPSAPQSAVS